QMTLVGLKQKAHRPPAGQEKIATAPYPHELRQALNLATHGLGLQRELVMQATEGLAGADQRIGIMIEAIEGGIASPGVLHKFELATDVRIQADEMQPPGLIVVALVQMAQ